jgi:3-dehydroquinate dehydratase/shikimate dehydrogenase
MWIGMLFTVIIGPTYDNAKSQILQANDLADGIELRLDLLESLSEEEKETLYKSSTLPIILNSGGESQTIQSDTSSMTICSHHNFEEVPKNLEQLLGDTLKTPADIYKIAALGHSTLDALQMLLFMKEKTSQGIKLSAICMGEKGQVSRILAPVFGSAINYAALDQPNAPGQLKISELSEIYHYFSLNKETSVYGLIGSPIVQSPSQITHNAFFRKNGLNAVYVKMQIEKEELASFFDLAKKLGIKGLSVTIPLKEAVLPFLDEIDPLAQEIGAVNTIVFEKGRMKGYNTDAAGALDPIETKLPVRGKKVVLLGAGGSAKAIAYEAKRRGAQLIIVARTVERAQVMVEKLGARLMTFEEMGTLFKEGYDILINTTPEATPIAWDHIRHGCVVMDINTKHRDTPFLQEALNRGCTVVYGYEMFMNQASGQFRLWFKKLNCYHFGPIVF